MNQPVEKPAQPPGTKPEQKTEPTTLLSTVDTFETVMNHVGKFLANPLLLIAGLITTIFLVTRGKNQNGNNLIAENAELKEQIRTLQSDLTDLKRKVKKLKAREQESSYMNDSQEYSIEYKAPLKLPSAERRTRTLYLD